MIARRSGRGLHRGVHADVILERRAGPLVVALGDREAPLVGSAIVSALRSTSIAIAGAELSTIEHLASALFALGITSELRIAVSGPELPLLDGGAAAWLSALEEAGFQPPREPAPATARVTRSARITEGDTTFELEPASHPSFAANVELGDARFDREVSWEGDAADYATRIATARTFAREADVMELADRGLAAHVPPESVVVLCKDSVLSRGAPFAPDEPARHKLLDLIGDVFVRCGVLAGRVRATRPGHRVNHLVLDRALGAGVIAFTDTRSSR